MREITIDKYETTKKYRGVPKGTQVYISHGPSYGLIGEDERETGMRHVMVNERNPFEDQTYNNFTFPSCMLRNIEETNPDVLNKLLEMNNEIKLNNDSAKNKIIKAMSLLPSDYYYNFYKENKIATMSYSTIVNIVDVMFDSGEATDYFSYGVGDIVCNAICLVQERSEPIKLFNPFEDHPRTRSINTKLKIEVELHIADEFSCVCFGVDVSDLKRIEFISIKNKGEV